MPRRLRPLWEASWRYARYSALKYPRAASLAINQERLVESVADHAKIRKQVLSLQNKLKIRISCERAFFAFRGSCYRQSARASMYILRLSIQRDCGFAVKRILLRRRLRGGCDKPPDAPPLTASHSSYMQLRHHPERDFGVGHGQYDLHI